MSNYSKTKAEALRQFKEQCNNYPLWSLWELGKRNPIYSNFLEGDESKTIKVFETALGDLYPDKIYTVKMFRDLRHRKGGQKFIAPNVEYSFQFDRVEQAPAMNGSSPAAANTTPIPQSPYAVDMSQRINLNDHVQLISAKAKAEADCSYFQSMYNDKVKECAELERELEELEGEFDQLEAEMKEMEEDADNEEKAKIGAAESTTMESAIASVIKENGGALLENMFSKGVKGAEELNGHEEEPEEDKKVVSGIPETSIMGLSIAALNEKMLALNPKWKQHLCKMILIGEQKPSTFKMFMNRLEAF